MGDFPVLINRVFCRQITDLPVAKKQRKVESEVDDDEDDIDGSVIDTLPKNQQVNAKMMVILYHEQQMGCKHLW